MSFCRLSNLKKKTHILKDILPKSSGLKKNETFEIGELQI